MEKAKLYYSIFMVVLIFGLLVGILVITYGGGGKTKYSLAGGKNDPTKNAISEFTDSYNNNDWSSAHKVADERLSANENDFNALLMKANALAQQGSLEFREKELGDQALTYVNQALEIKNDSAEALSLKGYIYEIEEDFPSAYTYYDQAISADPNYAEAYSRKGHAKQLEGLDNEAYKLFEQALQIDPDNVTANFGLARILVAQKKLSLASEAFLQIIKLNSNARQKAESYYTVGIISEVQNPTNLNVLTDYAKKAIAVDPSYPHAYVLLSRAQYESSIEGTDVKQNQQLRADSYKNLQNAISLYKNLSIAHLQLATQLNADGRKDDAKLILKSLPPIIQSDITLNKTEKDTLMQIVNNFITNISTK
jgi:tetratricopeptide (TPR) repeat protein